MEKVQFITHYTERYSYLDSARMALEGGCRWIQLRMKDAMENEILPVAEEVRNSATIMAPYSSSTTTWNW